MDDKQLSRFIFHNVLAIMKNTLNLEELSYREKGRDDPRYKTFKKHLMEFTYSTLREMFFDMEEWGLIVQTDDDEDVKHGYRENRSGGSGYLNTKELDEWLQEGN